MRSTLWIICLSNSVPAFFPQGQVTSSGASPTASSSSSAHVLMTSNSSSLHQPPPLLRPSLPATPSLHRQPPPLQQQARFLQPRPTLQQPPPLIRPSNPMPPRLNPRPAPMSLGGNPGVLGPSSTQQSSGPVALQSDTASSSTHWVMSHWVYKLKLLHSHFVIKLDIFIF